MSELSPTRSLDVASQLPGPGLFPAAFADSPLARALRQPMMLGLFLPVHSGGWSPSRLERGTRWDFDYNARLTRRAEEAGFDLVFGPAQWAKKGGYGGTTGFKDTSIDPFMTAVALAAVTERILLISTLHVLYGPLHPLHLAKFGATADHISGGRWGVNIVTGHRPEEPLMFGQSRIEHDRRYAMADEFTAILRTLWEHDENLTYRGEHWDLTDAYVTPRPRYGRPIIVNATGSPAGMQFAARHSDFVFVNSPGGAQIEPALAALPAHIANLKETARRQGREIRTLINPTIVCRATSAQAHAYARAIVESEDTEAVDNFAATRRASDAHAWRNHSRDQNILGGNIHLIGDPQEVVAWLLRLRQAGIDGIQISFFDFEPDLEFFVAHVLPLMKAAGLRLDDTA